MNENRKNWNDHEVFWCHLQSGKTIRDHLKDKQLRQIKAWYETKKGDGNISAESEEVLKEILNEIKILKKVSDNKVVRLTILQFSEGENYVFAQKANANL